MAGVEDSTLRRGLALLGVLASEEAVRVGGLGVVQIAERAAFEKSLVSRTLRTLAEGGLVERDPATRAYRLGWRLFALAARAGDPRLLAGAPPLLRRLTGELGERTHLSVLHGPEALALHSEAPIRAVQTVGWAGRLAPVWCTAAGRALLIDCSRSELTDLLGAQSLEDAGPNAPRDLDEVHERILAARAHGYAVADEEYEEGLLAVAAPVRDFRGRVAAAVDVSAPRYRLSGRRGAAAARVVAVADELSRRLGMIPPEPPPLGAGPGALGTPAAPHDGSSADMGSSTPV
ncbi:MAG: IclR family transcriptional regulator [Actinobacteria bacterium]|nr:IclR family transcriptional regulator [Actinomycetota bacterium]